jgi:rod shape determining protein RodA
VAAFARLNMIETINGSDGAGALYSEAPSWIKNWEKTGLIKWEDKNGDGRMFYAKDDRNEMTIDRDIMVLANPEIAKLPAWVIALVAAGGLSVLFLAGLGWRLIGLFGLLAAAGLPLLWLFGMHDYQRQRVLTLFDPERDPLGTGYHIIQSKIAIGSGGFYGKGWLEGSQTRLHFLPESATDFVFAVFGEEFGLLGVIGLLLLYGFIIGRGMHIAMQASDGFGRLLGGGLVCTFFVYVLVNIGMVSGLFPVVGVPLPLVSYGGTSMVTLMLGFGMLMGIRAHRKLWPA